MPGEIPAQNLNATVEAILADKARGVDCDEDGSAHVKRAIRRELLRTDPPYDLCDALMRAFPLEWDEVLSENPHWMHVELWARAREDLRADSSTAG